MTDSQSLFYISFAGRTGFLGATVVEASSPADALDVATGLGLNPGGEAMIISVPPEAALAPEIVMCRNRLVGAAELRSVGCRPMGELRPEDRAMLEARAEMLCGDCNEL